ncbi:hypothetical protein [Flavobacterium pallidum]|nr:hypothetical protein [Flavobacterium pallidum]
MKYLKFEIPESHPENAKPKFLEQFFGKVARKIFPVANPDFEGKIADVKFWMVEYDDENGAPEREIGLNSHQEVVLKMPYKDNYGYWTDNNLLFDDFRKSFSCIEIDSELFEQQWRGFNP